MSNQTAGFVCAHHHLYSSLVRGMPAPAKTPQTFIEILEQVWWRVDAALDAEMIHWSAMLGATEALLNGTTCIIDHHESPNYIEGSLEIIASACAQVGVRVNVSYGVTDRWDNNHQLHSKVSPLSTMTQGAKRGLDETDRFLSTGRRGMVGVHAAFTCSDETLEAASQLARKHGVGVHIHVAEAKDDQHAGARLAGLATNDWLLVHGVHLNQPLPGFIVHNPRSNMNNAVGYTNPTRHSNTILLGTDGIGADMLEEARLAFVRLRESDLNQSPDTVWSWLENSYALFPEALNDKVWFNYDQAKSPWHVAYTPGVRAVDVEIDGKLVVKNGQPINFDLQEVRTKAAEQAKRLHERLATS